MRLGKNRGQEQKVWCRCGMQMYLRHWNLEKRLQRDMRSLWSEKAVLHPIKSLADSYKITGLDIYVRKQEKAGPKIRKAEQEPGGALVTPLSSHDISPELASSHWVHCQHLHATMGLESSRRNLTRGVGENMRLLWKLNSVHGSTSNSPIISLPTKLIT